MSVRETTTAHEVAYQDLCQLLKRHEALPAEEVLAVAANMVGKLAALCDPKVTDARRAMEIISRNIELGNAQAAEAMRAGDDGRRH